jgi:hypothetical protein
LRFGSERPTYSCVKIVGCGDGLFTLDYSSPSAVNLVLNGQAAADNLTLYVSPNGYGSTCCGALTFPCDTIQRAIDGALPGSRVVLLGGVYTGTNNVLVRLRGKHITVKSLNGPANVTIDCQGIAGSSAFLLMDKEPSTAVIEGITIKNCRALG